jgi:hypothetical protein
VSFYCSLAGVAESVTGSSNGPVFRGVTYPHFLVAADESATPSTLCFSMNFKN